MDDPWKVPSYKFPGLVLAWLTEDKEPEAVGQIDDALSQADSYPHPFLIHAKATAKVLASLGRPTRAVGVVEDQLMELPIEEQKRQEAAALGKPFIVPSWWRGEKANYKVAQIAMRTIPRDIGPIQK